MNSDPFDIVKDKVNEKLRSVKVLQEMYAEQMNGAGSIDDISINELEMEIKNNIQSIDLFLGDLQQTINVVEKNPQRFRNITAEEIGKRKLYVSTTSQQMRQIEQQLKNRKQRQAQQQKDNLFQAKKGSSSQLADDDNYQEQPVKKSKNGAFSRLEESYVKDNQRFIDEQLQIQDKVKQDQDVTLERMITTTQRVGQIAVDIGDELDQQKRELEDMDQHVSKTRALLDRTNKRLQNLLKNTSDKWKIIIIVVLLVVILGLFALIAIPF